MDIKQCFEILELDCNATLEEAKQAYKDLVIIWHPDRVANNPRLKLKAEKKIKSINLAYESVKSYIDANKGQTTQSRINQDAFQSTAESVAEVGTEILLNAFSQISKKVRNINYVHILKVIAGVNVDQQKKDELNKKNPKV